MVRDGNAADFSAGACERNAAKGGAAIDGLAELDQLQLGLQDERVKSPMMKQT